MAIPMRQWYKVRRRLLSSYVITFYKRSYEVTEDLTRRWARGPANFRRLPSEFGCSTSVFLYILGTHISPAFAPSIFHLW